MYKKLTPTKIRSILFIYSCNINKRNFLKDKISLHVHHTHYVHFHC